VWHPERLEPRVLFASADPAGYWPLDEGAGAAAADASPNGNAGTLLGGAAWSVGRNGAGTGLRLDGVDDRVGVPDSASLDVTTAITLAAWVAPAKLATQYVIKKSAIDAADGYELSLSAAGQPFVRFNQHTRGDALRVNSPTTYPTDGKTWVHLAATYDGATIRLYVNGAAVANKAAAFSIAANDLPLTLGAEANGYRAMAGGLDDARVYPRALSVAEIAALAGAAPVNAPPSVDAGIDRAVPISRSASLDGAVRDDGLPGPALSTWSQVSGPGVATFANAAAAKTTVRFTAAGTYVLRLSATDGQLSAADTVTVVVSPDPAPQPLEKLPLTTDTESKPQSKLWFNRGVWWAVLPDATGTWVWRLDGTHWTQALKLSAGTKYKADVKSVGDVAHVLLFDPSGGPSQLASVEYVAPAAGAAATYRPWSARPVLTPVQLSASAETATIELDGAGRLWLASDASTTIKLRYSDAPYSAFSDAFNLATGISTDDICTIAAFPDGSVGVMWSNQVTKRFGFRTHAAGAAPTAWSADELPASQSALDNVGLGMADDHLNAKVAADGTLYVAAKTSYDTAGYPMLVLLVRRPSGKWDDLYTVANSGTRPIVLLNEFEGSLIVAYRQDGTGNIVTKRSPLSQIAFGAAQLLIAGPANNVTSTKQNFTAAMAAITDDLVVVATDPSNLLVGTRRLWP
jgi:hypothetical protein